MSDDAAKTEAAEVTRLAALSPFAYDREREASAKKLGVRPETLDEVVKGKRGKHTASVTQSKAERRYSNPPKGRRTPGDPTLAQLAAAKAEREKAAGKKTTRYG